MLWSQNENHLQAKLFFLSQYLVFISWWCGCVSVAFVGDIALDKDDLHFFRRDLTEKDLPHTTSHSNNTVAGVCLCVCTMCALVCRCAYTLHYDMSD